MKVLLVGSGGREHAIAWKLSQSKKLSKLYCAPGNPGTAQFGENVDIADTDIEALVKFAQGADIDLAVIGPEDPLAAGAVDAFEAGRTFTNFADAKAYIASRDEAVVVKAAGLAKGKGVFVCDEPSEGILAAEQIMTGRIFGDAGNTVIVEDKLLGQEASILAFVDGRSIYVMESSQDHKPIGEGDTGPNTGGMGAYCPAPIVTDKLMAQIVKEILVPTIDGMNRCDAPYRGILYAGLMLTQGGPRVLEYNCRFGDPETQPILMRLMRLKSDLLQVMLAVCDGKLDTVDLKWDPRPAVCVVVSSGGYPGSYEKGKVIEGLDEAAKLKDVVVFHAGTAKAAGKIVTNGGRVLGVTALGDTIAAAQARAYEAVDTIRFEGAYCRRDIADKALK
ncbi:MAG: phosphoribosylamine--glycine ligase [Planctomycetota bacterium]|jgi:phosphoribosylamine--glycine ligase